MLLPNGTVIPSFMGVSDTSSLQGATGFFDEISMMVGEVVDIIYPDNIKNTSKKFTEYTVSVWRRDSSGPVERLAFRCFQSETFGSIADWFRFSFRSATNTATRDAITNGATVLIACVNGDRSNSYIIGAIPQPNRQEPDPSKSEGRYMKSRFNGVEMNIRDDGSFELRVPGATDSDGNPDQNRDKKNKGSKMSFAANGDITIDDEDGESVRVSPGDKTIEVISQKKLNEVSEEVTIQGRKSWTLRAPHVTVLSKDVNIGDSGLDALENGVVYGGAIDTFTGTPYAVLGNASTTVKVTR